MKQTINVSDFRDAFMRSGRGGQFSYEALGLLFDYFEHLEEDFGEEMELDVVAICCQYSEDTYQGIAKAYDIDIEGLDEEEAMAAVRDYLEQNTTIVGTVGDDSFVYDSEF